MTATDGGAVLYEHPSPLASGERCYMCPKAWGPAATHKVSEVTNYARHPLTTFVCCGHFAMIMGPLAGEMCRQS